MKITIELEVGMESGTIMGLLLSAAIRESRLPEDKRLQHIIDICNKVANEIDQKVMSTIFKT